MPCDSIQRSSVNLELKADNREFLIAALKSLGYFVQDLGETLRFWTKDREVAGIFYKNQLTLSGYNQVAETFDVNPIKRAYSVQVVQAAAQQFGWQLQQQEEFTFAVQKDTFEQSIEGGF